MGEVEKVKVLYKLAAVGSLLGLVFVWPEFRELLLAFLQSVWEQSSEERQT